MTIKEYTEKINKISFEEFPYSVNGSERHLCEIVNFEMSDLQLKIHLTEVIICRCFSPTGGIYFPTDTEWFIKEFLEFYETDLAKPWLTSAIKEAINMILCEDPFTKRVIGTSFMFGIIEFYAKYLLGFRPMEPLALEIENQGKFKKMFLRDAIHKLKIANSKISDSLNRIDKHCVERMKELGIEESDWIKAKIADRITVARNSMLHGENHSFYDTGEYLVMIYILFHLNGLTSNAVNFPATQDMHSVKS